MKKLVSSIRTCTVHTVVKDMTERGIGSLRELVRSGDADLGAPLVMCEREK